MRRRQTCVAAQAQGQAGRTPPSPPLRSGTSPSEEGEGQGFRMGRPAALSFLIVRSSIFSVAIAVFSQFSAVSPRRAPDWTDRSTHSVFLHPEGPRNARTPQKRWETAIRECAEKIPIGNFPAFRSSGSALDTGGGIAGQHGGQRGPAEAEGRTGRGPAVKPRRRRGRRRGRRTRSRKGWRIGWRIGWPIGGGGPESGKLPACFFVRFFRGRRLAAAGALRALTEPI